VKPEETVHVTGKQLLDVYLDGLVSGICTALSTFSPLAENQIIHIAQRLGNGMVADDAGKELLLNEIRERLEDTDTGPKKAVVPVDMGRIPLGPEAN
jgi:hypothetical protein